MAIKDMEELRFMTVSTKKRTVVISGAADDETIKAACMVQSYGIGDLILIGDSDSIAELCEKNGLTHVTVIDARTEEECARMAVKLVHRGDADVLMKGMVNSSTILKAVLDPDKGLRTGKLLSHMAAFEVPGQNRLHFHSDGGMNTYPNLEQKKQIVTNAVDALHALGYCEPRVAILTANEKISEKMPSTVDAAALVEMNKSGELPGCIVEGPIAMDVALSRHAAEHKGIESRISGETDLFIAPNIEAGNMVGKTLIYAAGAKMAGVILGASAPVVLVSRGDNAAAKTNSMALACAIADGMK